MISAQRAFRLAVEKELGGKGITPGERLADAVKARRCRNLFFSATAPVVDNGSATPDVIVQAQTRPLGIPVIVADMLNFFEPYVTGFYPGVIWQLQRIFVTGVGPQEDFFGAGNFLASLFTLGHYQASRTNGSDAPSNKTDFLSYLMRPGEIFQFSWELLDIGSTTQDATCPEAFIRGLTVLPQDDKTGELCGTLKQQVCSYIAKHDPETFILDLRIPSTSFPASGVTRAFSTPLQERPLLVYGIGTNITGAQVTFRDDGLRWEFCIAPTVPRQAIVGGVPAAGVYPASWGTGLPITAVSNNGDAQMHEAYNMLPVPHLLAPNTSLTFRLTNGIRPDGTTGAYQQTMSTVNNFGASTGDGHITLLCRTV